MTRLNRFLRLMGLGALGSVLVVPGVAQELEEVVVTAKQREESLQDVPLTINVFSEDLITKTGIQDIRDIAQLTPNFTFYSGTGRSDPSAIVVRGVSPNTSDERYQAVSIFVDGVYVSGQLTSLNLSQLERVEIIKGPQSATYGRATYSAAIDYVTKTPTSNEFSGRFTAGFSQHEEGDASNRVGASLDIPVVEDKLWVSLNAQSSQVGALTRTPDTGRDVGREDTRGFGGVVYWEPDDTWSVKARVAYDEDRDSVSLVHVQHLTDWDPNTGGLFQLPNGSFWIDGAIPDPVLGTTGHFGLNNFRPLPDAIDRDRTFFSLVVTKELWDGYELSYRGGVFNQKYFSNGDFTFRPQTGDPLFGADGPDKETSFFRFFQLAFQEEFENTSHQVRLVSPSDRRLRWSAGFYIFEEDDINRRPTAFSATNPDGKQRGQETIENTALMGAIEYDFTDKLTAGLELRFQDEEVTYASCVTCPSGNRLGRDLSESETDVNPRFTVEYNVNDNHLVYGVLARGTKSGRWNTTPFLTNPADRSQEQFFYAPPEQLDNLEIGWKSTWLDGRAVMNVAAFYQDIQDQQFRVSVRNPIPNATPIFINQVATAGDSESIGFEIDGAFAVTENFTVSGGFGLADHEFKDPVVPTSDLQLFTQYDATTTITTGPSRPTSLQGLTSVNTPKWSGNLSLEYVFPALGGKDVDLELRSDSTFVAKRYTELSNTMYIDSFSRTNLRATLVTDTWRMGLFIRDAFDDETALGAGLTGTSTCYFPQGVAGQRCQFTAIPRGREIGLEASFRFGED